MLFWTPALREPGKADNSDSLLTARGQKVFRNSDFFIFENGLRFSESVSVQGAMALSPAAKNPRRYPISRMTETNPTPGVHWMLSVLNDNDTSSSRSSA